MFKAIAMFFRSIQGLLKVVDINVHTLEELSSVGNDMAKGFRAEYQVQQRLRMEAIERGEDPDAE
jgi:hypothetical protein